MVTAHIGQDAVLPCEVEGDTSPRVTWRKDGFPITQDNNKYDQTTVLVSFYFSARYANNK